MESKESYEEYVSGSLQELKVCIEGLRAKAEAVQDAETQEYSGQIEALSRIEERAREKLQQLKEADHERWENLQPAMEGLLSEMRNAVANVSLRLQ